MTVSSPPRTPRLGARWLRGIEALAGGGGLVLILAITALNLSNFVFHVVVSRVIGPASYGELGALLNIIVVLAIPLGALQAAVAQVVAERTRSLNPPGLRGLLRWALLAGFAGTVLWLILVEPVDRGLRIGSPVATASLALWIGPTVLSAVLQGVLLGQRRFRPLALSQLVGAGLVRLLAAVILTKAGLGVTGAVLATPISGVATCLMLLFALRGTLFRRSELTVHTGDAFRSIAGLGGATLLTSIDAWLARSFLPATHAGYFSAASTAGRICLFLPAAVTTVVFPSLAATGGRGSGARREFRRGLLMVAGVCLVSVVILVAVPHVVVAVLFGSKFSPAATILPIIAVADGGIALVSFLVYFFLARRSRWALAAWGSCVLAFGLGAAFHGSGRVLALDMLVTNLGTAVVLGGAAVWSMRRDAVAPAPVPVSSQEPDAGGGSTPRSPRGRSMREPALNVALVGVAALAVLFALDGNVAGGALAVLAVAALSVSVTLGVVHFWRGREVPSPHGLFRPRDATRLLQPSVVAVVSVAFVAVVAAQSWFARGKVIAGGDITPPVGTAWIGHIFSAWTWNGSTLGGPSALAQLLPWAVVSEVVQTLGGSAGLAQRLWLTCLFTSAAVAAHLLLRVLGFRPLPAALGALVFVFNPCTLSEVGINAVYLAAMVLMAAFPAVIVAVGRQLLSVRVGLLVLLASAPLIGYTYQNPPLLLVLVGSGMAGLVLAAVVGGRAAFRRSLRLAALGIPLVAVACLYWMVPAVIQAGTAATGRLSASSSWGWTEGRATLQNGIWLNTEWGWRFPAYYPYAPHYARFPLAALKYLLPLLAFASLPLLLLKRSGALGRRLSATVFLIAGLALFLIVLSTGTRFPGDVFFDPLYRLPFGWLLREPGRFLVVAGLCYSVLIAATAQTVETWWVARARRATEVRDVRPVQVLTAVGLTMAAVLAPSYPLAFGQVASIHSTQPTRRSHVAVPSSWTAMAAYLNGSSSGARAPGGSLLVLPADDFYQMPYTWDYYGNDSFITDLIRRQTLVPSGQGYGTVSNELLADVGSVANALTDRQWRTADNLLGALGTSLVLVRGDIAYGTPDRKIVDPALIAAGLERDPDARLVHTDGPLRLFEVQPAPTGSNVVTVNTTTPDLGALAFYPRGTALVSVAPRRGVPGLLQLASPAAWTLRGAVLSTTVRAPTDFRYRTVRVPPSPATGSTTEAGTTPGRRGSDRAVVAREAVRRITTTRENPSTIRLDLAVGPELVGNDNFARGPWQAVSNCHALPGVSARGQLAAVVMRAAAPGGENALQLTAGVDAACENEPIRWTGGPVLLSMLVHESTPSGRVCAWEANLERCAPAALRTLPSGSGWSRFQTIVTPDRQATSLELYLYDYAGSGAPTSSEYADVSAHAVTDDQPVLLAEPLGPRHRLALLQTGETFDRQWQASRLSQHVVVDGLRNGWIADTSVDLRGGVRYGWSRPVSVALDLSAVAAGLGILLLAFPLIAIRRRRKGAS